MTACLMASGLFAQVENKTVVALAIVKPEPSVVKQAKACGGDESLAVLANGLEVFVSGYMTEHSPFAVMGGRAAMDMLMSVEKSTYADKDKGGQGFALEGEKVAARYGAMIQILGYTESKQKSRKAGRAVAECKVTATVSLTIYDVVARMQIGFASTSFSSTATPIVADDEEYNSVKIDVQGIMEEIAKGVVEKLVATIQGGASALIVDVDDDDEDDIVVTLNLGKGWCKVGDELEIYGAPKEKDSPAAVGDRFGGSGKTIIIEGKLLGTVRITRIAEDSSRGKVTLRKGKKSDELDGAIVKRKQEEGK